MTGIFNARVLASIAMLVFVGAIVASSTGAFFSDTETSTGNTFTAGEIDLKIDNSSYGFDWNNPEAVDPNGTWGPNENNSWELSDLTNQLFFSFADLKPGDYGEDTISLHVQNDAYACMALDLTGTPENGVNEAELEGLPVDATSGADQGELQKYLSFIFWHDDGDNVLEEGEDVIESLTGLPGTIFTGNWLAIADSGTGAPLPAAEDEDDAAYIGKGWCFGTLTATPETPAENPNGPTIGNTGFTCDGSGNNNDAQTDGITVDVDFYAVQSRNNGQFLCSSLNEGEPEPGTATLTLRKQVNQDGVDPVMDAAWTLSATSTTDSVVGTDNDPNPSPAITSISVEAGNYTLSESAGPAGFTFQGVQCTDGTLVGNVLTLADGDNATCTFTNVENNQQGT